MVELIDIETLEAVANTVADTGFDFRLLTKVLSTFAGMNIATYIYEYDLRLGDFPTPHELVGSMRFTRRRGDIERRVTPATFDRLINSLVASDGRSFAVANMESILYSMQDVVEEDDEERRELEEAFALPAYRVRDDS